MAVSFTGGASLPTPGTAGYAAAQSGNGSVSNAGSNQYSSNTSAAPVGGGSPILGGPQSPAPAVPSTINAGSLGSQTPISAPNYATNSNSNAFVSSLPGSQPAPTNADGGGSTTSNPGTDPFKGQFSQYYGNLISQLGQEGPEFKSLQQQYQIPQITQNLADLRGTIAQRTAGYAAQYQLANTEHAALPYITGEQTQIQRTQAVELGVLGAQEQALSGNLQAATDLVNQTITHEFDPIKNMISASAQWYQIHQNDLSDSEKAQFQLNSSLVQQNYQNLYSAKSDAYKTAIQYGASSTMLSALANAQSVPDVYNALSGLTSGGSGTGAGTGSVVNGYDLSTYATDPSYGSKIQNASSSIGTIANTQQAQQVISASAPGSPVTGDMIANAATTYGVDPNMIASVLKVESNFGTAGVGAKTNNPGNVGNTDSGATTKYSSWQNGVNAVAQQLQNRKATVQDAISTNTVQANQKAVTATAPLLVQPAIRFTSGGTPFIDSSRLSTDAGTMAQVYAARSGIPILNDADVKAVQGLDTAMNNLNSMSTNFKALADGGGPLGKAYFLASAPLNKFFDTNYGASLKAYQGNRDNLFQQISALAGSHPRINTQELETAANSLPKLSEGFLGFGSNVDSLKDGNAKVAIVQKYLDNSLKAILPTYNPVRPLGDIPPAVIGNAQFQANSDGTYTRIK